MMKSRWFSLCLFVSSGAMCAQQSDSCAGLEDSALAQCSSTQEALRQQQRFEQLLQQQQERQNQLDRQQREVQQQLETMRIQNENLRKQLEHATPNQPARSAAMDSRDSTVSSRSSDVRSWRADNSWFGSDYAKTQFAMRYIEQLQRERPDLTGRALLDALSTKINATFVAKR